MFPWGPSADVSAAMALCYGIIRWIFPHFPDIIGFGIGCVQFVTKLVIHVTNIPVLKRDFRPEVRISSGEKRGKPRRKKGKRKSRNDITIGKVIAPIVGTHRSHKG